MKNILAALLFSIILLQANFSQQSTYPVYQYISPVPGSALNQPETNIIIRYGTAYDISNIADEPILEVKGSKSGLHTGKIKTVENDNTILFKPDIHFTEGETVTVKLIKTIITVDGDLLPELNYNFRITEKNLNKSIIKDLKKYLPEYISSEFRFDVKKQNNNSSIISLNDSLPEDFPAITVNVYNNPSPGMIFLSPFIFPGFYGNYLIIADNYGTPIFYRKMNSSNFDFKKQSTGVLTYYENGLFYVMNGSYNIIDSLHMQNGYSTDLHELLLHDNGHALMMCYDAQPVAMDTVVTGGDPNAMVIGLVIQELDENKNVLFQWRSWDHFKITDATSDIDLTAAVIDYVHGNAIEVDYDGNLLISSRHLDEITKISRQTGNIIWRLGGEHCKNNQFTFINDPIGFSHQHDIRRISNGNITLFDNGNLHDPPLSRGVEYQLDEIFKYAQLISDYRNNPATLSWAMGSSRRLENHNTIIGWGTGLDPAITEVKIDGSVALSFSLPDTMPNYRAFKSPWKTNLFRIHPEFIYFGYVPLGDSLEKSVEVINNSNQTIQINDSYNRLSPYQLKTDLPISIPPLGSSMITVRFKPQNQGDYFDDLHLRWQKENERIARVVPLIGSTDPNFTSVDDGQNEMRDYYLSQNYPNPFNPSTIIGYQLPISSNVTLKVYDLLGREVATLVDEYRPAGSYEVEFNASDLTSGIYFYKLQTDNYIETKKMILLK